MSSKQKKALISQSALAEMAGVSRQAVGLAKANFPTAFVGKKVDLSHPDVQAWLRAAAERSGKGQSPAPAGAAPTEKKPGAKHRYPLPTKKAADLDDDLPDDDRDPDDAGGFDGLADLETTAIAAGIMSTADVEALPNMTLNEIYSRFGTQEAFKDLMTARKLIPEIRLKDMQAEEKRGEFIPRAMVKKYIVPLIDNQNKRLLEDLPQTLAAKLIKLAKADEPVETIAEKIRADISKIIKDVKGDAMRHIDA